MYFKHFYLIFFRPLVLETMKRCKITDIQASNCEKSISVQLCEDESAQTVCKLRESWYHTNLSVGNIVNIVAEYKENEWIIDNTNGLLILSPDTLISGTTLMGSMFCRRRAVLANSFPTVEAGAKCMVIGSSVHLLLQKVSINENLALHRIHIAPLRYNVFVCNVLSPRTRFGLSSIQLFDYLILLQINP